MENEELQEALHRLEVSEVRYRKLFETAKDGILLIDPATDAIIDANPYLLEMIGYSHAETVGKKLWDIQAFRDIEVNKKAFEILKQKKYIHYEDLPLQNKSGKEISVEFVSNVYPVDGSTMIQCNIRDITARKKAEDKARDYLAELEKINGFMTGREVKMADLKKEIEVLKNKISSDLTEK